MAGGHYWFLLFCVLTGSFSVLYSVLNSSFDDVCDYEGVVDSCSEWKSFTRDPVHAMSLFKHDWHVKAMEMRNASEKQKCAIEQTLQEQLRSWEKDQAMTMINQCMKDFRDCVAAQYTTTRTTTQLDCTECQRYCRTTNWVDRDPQWASLMQYTGMCSGNVCPWNPTCGYGAFIHEKCSEIGCGCTRDPCKSTGVTSTETTITTTTTTLLTSTSTTTTRLSSTSTTLLSSTTTTTTKASSTSTTTSTTSSSTTSTITTTTTSSTTTTITTTTSTTLETSTTTTDCVCLPAVADTVLVGRPKRPFFGDNTPASRAEVVYHQGVVIEPSSNIVANMRETHSCFSYFSDRTKYAGPRGTSNPQQAMQDHIDLGCGYAGSFDILCSKSPLGQCQLSADISTCIPPTYQEALDACYTLPPTTTFQPLSSPTVPDWLQVNELPFDLVPLPDRVPMTPPTLASQKCCEVHVASACERNRNWPEYGTHKDGQWDASMSYHHGMPYFPVVECSLQATSMPRYCPRVNISLIDRHPNFPQCHNVCNLGKVQAQLAQVCKLEDRTHLTAAEEKALADKIQSMKDHRAMLESWSHGRSPKVTAAIDVIDCIDDKLPRRFNSLGAPTFSGGFEKLRLHNQCRLHGCKPSQCLKIRTPCPVEQMNSPPEVQCSNTADQTDYQCVDKVTLMGNNPLSLGFGIGWAGFALLMFCGAAASKCKRKPNDRGVHAEEGDEEEEGNEPPSLLGGGPRDAGDAQLQKFS